MRTPHCCAAANTPPHLAPASSRSVWWGKQSATLRANSHGCSRNASSNSTFARRRGMRRHCRAGSAARGAPSCGCKRKRQPPSAFSTRCARRTSRSWSSPATFAATVCRCRRFTRRIWTRRLPGRGPGRHHAVRVSGGSIAPATKSRPQVVEAYRKVVAAAPLPGGGRPRSELQSLLSARQLRPPVDRLGSELFQVLLPATGGRAFNEQALEDDFGRLTSFCSPRRATIFFIAISSRATSCCATGSRVSSITRAGARARCNTTLLRCCSTPRPTCRRSCARQLLDHYLDALAGCVPLDRAAFLEHYYAYVYVRIMQALGAYGFRGFYERKAHFLQACRTR